jgi:hypothetical protein
MNTSPRCPGLHRRLIAKLRELVDTAPLGSVERLLLQRALDVETARQPREEES